MDVTPPNGLNGVVARPKRFESPDSGFEAGTGVRDSDYPVILEYKRALNENVINQGLFYLDWLMDHRKDFGVLGVSSRLACGETMSAS